MTAQNEDKMREEFEKVSLRMFGKRPVRYTGCSKYAEHKDQANWQLWQAAIAQGEQERKKELLNIAENAAHIATNQANYIRELQAQLSESQKREAALQAEVERLKLASRNSIHRAIKAGDEILKHKETIEDLRTSLSGQIEEIEQLRIAAVRSEVATTLHAAEKDELKRKFNEQCAIFDAVLNPRGTNLHSLSVLIATERAAERQKVLTEMREVGKIGYVDHRSGRDLAYCLMPLDGLKMGDKIYALPESPQPAAQGEGEGEGNGN